MEAEDVDVNDPFSDRKHGPRTRARARAENRHGKEEEEEVDDQDQASRNVTPLPVKEQATHESFAKLEPAPFPSLDPTITLKEKEETLYQREIERCVEREVNTFYIDEDKYFGENQELVHRQATDFVEGQTPNRKRAYSTLEGPSLSQATSKRVKLEAFRTNPPAREVIGRDTHYHYRGGSELYKTFLTKHPASGKVVRWHQRVRKEEPADIQNLNSRIRSAESPGSSETPELVSNNGSDTESSFDSNMAENAPVANNDDATRGMPYYDRLKKTLKTSIKQKQESDENLAKIEQSIWSKEAAYLDDTVAGNIMKGFDNYIKASGAPGGPLTGGGTASRKKATVSEQDRLFSRSSVGFWNSMREGSPHASATSTPSHAPTPKGLSDHPTPTSTTSTKAPGLKKKKATEKDDESDSKPSNKRLKITFSRTDKD